MKHPYAFSFLLLASSASAQISLTSLDMPVLGDVITNSVDTLPTTSPGASGALQSWDFGDATEHFQQAQSFVDPSTTPYASSYPTATLASTPDDASYIYYENSPSGFRVVGSAGDPLGLGIIFNAPFDPDLTMHEFPRTYTSSFNNDYGIDLTADGSSFGVYQVRYKQVGHVHDTTDAYGAITTPVGTYDCLRSFNRTATVDSIWAKLFVFTPWQLIIATSDTLRNYTWYSKETKLFVADMSLDSLGNPTRFSWSNIAPISTGLVNLTARNSATLYPQPATDAVRFTDATLTGTYTITDLHGALVAQGLLASANGRIPVNGLAPGTYTLAVRNANGLRWQGKLVRAEQR